LCSINRLLPGDVNGDGQFNELDVAGLVGALTLNPPNPGTIEFCRADANGDNILNGLDIIAFIFYPPTALAAACSVAAVSPMVTAN
jgi:hypothetical protein